MPGTRDASQRRDPELVAAELRAEVEGWLTPLSTAIVEHIDAEGISIPFPQRDVHFHQTNGSGAKQA